MYCPFEQLQVKLSKMAIELTEERVMNASLQQNQSHWQAKVVSLEKRLEQKDKVRPIFSIESYCTGKKN